MQRASLEKKDLDLLKATNDLASLKAENAKLKDERNAIIRKAQEEIKALRASEESYKRTLANWEVDLRLVALGNRSIDQRKGLPPDGEVRLTTDLASVAEDPNDPIVRERIRRMNPTGGCRRPRGISPARQELAHPRVRRVRGRPRHVRARAASLEP